MKRVFLIVFIVVIIIAFTGRQPCHSEAKADILPVFIEFGGAPKPLISSHSIQLREITIKVELKRYLGFYYTIKQTLKLYNAGDTKTFRLAFPSYIFKNYDLPTYGYHVKDLRIQIYRIKNLKLFVNGSKVPLQNESGASPLFLNSEFSEYLSRSTKITFPKNETTNLQVTYQARISYKAIHDKPYWSSESKDFAALLLGTCTFWHGTIGKVIIIVDSTDYCEPAKPKVIWSATAETKSLSDNVLILKATNYDPEPDEILKIIVPSS